MTGRTDVSGAVAERHPEAAVVVPPRKDAVPSGTAETAPTQRDRHLRLIAERGRLGWQKASGYHRRALAEVAISRYKRVVGDTLRSRTDGRTLSPCLTGLCRLLVPTVLPEASRTDPCNKVYLLIHSRYAASGEECNPKRFTLDRFSHNRHPVRAWLSNAQLFWYWSG